MTWHAKAALGAQLQYIKDNAEKVLLINTYASEDTYATVAGNSVGEAAITDADFGGIVDGVPTTSQRMTFSGKTGAATSDDPGTTLWMAIVDVTGTEVLAVTDETTDQPITDLNPITFPSFYMQANQPALV